MAIQNRRGLKVDFDPFKMLPGEFGYVLDREELYYCIAPGNVKRVATKEELIEILDTAGEAYTALQQLISELESETVLTGVLADISSLLDRTAQNESDIGDLASLPTVDKSNLVGAITEIDSDLTSHLAEDANNHMKESGNTPQGYYIRFEDGTQICYGELTVTPNPAGSSHVFPKPFSSKPSASVNTPWILSGQASVITLSEIATYPGYVEVKLVQLSEGTITMRDSDTILTYLAIGRWK